MKPHFPILDLIRSVAAFLVVLEHARNYLMVDFVDLEHPSGFWKLIYFVSGFGHVAVLAFFVLSGCLIGMIVIRDFGADRWSWVTYLFNRLSRLWTVLIPALLLTLIFDSLTLIFAKENSFPLVGNFAHIQYLPLLERIGPEQFLGNLFFVQRILVNSLGSNGPLWSLAYEFWYYVLFPLIYAVSQTQRFFFKVISMFLVLACGYFVGRDILLYFPVWLMGVVGIYFYFKGGPTPLGAAIGLALSGLGALTVMALYRMGMVQPLLRSSFAVTYVMGSLFALVVYFSLFCQVGVKCKQVAHFLSSFSYTLYLVHLPFMTLVVSLFISNNSERLQPSFMAFVWLFILILGSYVVSYGVYWITERRTTEVRFWLARLLGIKSLEK